MPERMKFNLQNYIQAVLEQVKHRTEAYHLNVDGDKLSLWRVLTQHTRSMCAQLRSVLVGYIEIYLTQGKVCLRNGQLVRISDLCHLC